MTTKTVKQVHPDIFDVIEGGRTVAIVQRITVDAGPERRFRKLDLAICKNKLTYSGKEHLVDALVELIGDGYECDYRSFGGPTKALETLGV